MAWRRKDKNDENRREGEVLGLGGATIERDPHVKRTGEPVGTSGDVETTSATGGLRRTPGATGIDMGAGGTGTDIER